jgi:prepilin-type N-terminal cleavage/methylation domain-containing protein
MIKSSSHQPLRRARISVAQICNLLYRRIAFGKGLIGANRTGESTRSRLKICDTAESSSALQWCYSAFTLVELLVVIAIIAVLAALLLPAVSAAKGAALKKKARVQVNDIANAIVRYDATYSHYPTGQAPGNNDFTYGGYSYFKITGALAPAWSSNNDEVISILMDITNYPGQNVGTINNGHVKNTQQIKFLNATMVGSTNENGVGPDLVYRDPWYNPYIITMDLNYNESTQDAFYKLANVSQTPGANNAAGINGLTDISDNTGALNDYEYHGGVMVWSLGPDGKADMTTGGPKANQGVNRDNILSWHE